MLIERLEKDIRVGRYSFVAMLEIVNQLAEEHKDKDCSKCSRRSWYQKGYEDAEKDNGWIPCSERLPEESGEYLTYVKYGNTEFYNIDEIDCEGIMKRWNIGCDCEILAWKPIAPYKPKGE